MLLTRTVTKKILEQIVHESFTKFGRVSSSSLLDSLKLLGFHYATNAGISINIEDLKTPNVKKDFIDNANQEIIEISKNWQQGFVSDTERFQKIIDSWNYATENLKNKIVSYYQNLDPANNLYIMAFSGARGNMSQVRQLVGMRGLMSDQEGNIIDLPIQANFREGLSTIDYIISSYGARKGIVDTALKTADSGYLTRRLIYVAQDLVIRQHDCKTDRGVLIELKPNTNITNLIGRTLIDIPTNFHNQEYQKDIILTREKLNTLTKQNFQILNVRSPLNCLSHGSICQKCYGWDLAQGNLITLGETVGIIAAQSIGEPGTQLTMRTFHTGGIFTGEILKEINAPFSGKIIIPDSLKITSYRTNHGTLIFKLQQETVVQIISWDGKIEKIFLDIGYFLYKNKSGFIKKNELIAEYSTQTLVPGTRRLKPIYTSINGEIRFENLMVRKMLRDKRTVKINQDDGMLWIASGTIFLLPNESKFLFPSKLKRTVPFAKLKIISPISGLVTFKNNILIVKNKKKSFSLNLNNISSEYKNCLTKLRLLIKNYQYIDKQTIISVVELYPNSEGNIYHLRQKQSQFTRAIFVVGEDDVWKMNSDNYANFNFNKTNKNLIRIGNTINTNSRFSQSGFFLKQNGFQMIFQKALPVFLSRGTILNNNQGDFVFKNEIFASLVNYAQQTEDIVQGLPKIEELIEARKPKIKATLSVRPGVLLHNSILAESRSQLFNRLIDNGVINCIYKHKKEEAFTFIATNTKRNQDKQTIHIGHSIFLKENLVIFNKQIFKIFTIPKFFFPKQKKNNIYNFVNSNNQILLVNGKSSFSNWEQSTLNETNCSIYKYEKAHLIKWLTLKQSGHLYTNKCNDIIVETSDNHYLFLEYVNPITEYEVPLTSKLLFNPGNFIDIGEPLTEGVIDIHELLSILFNYHLIFDGLSLGVKRSLNKFQLLLVNSIQAIYQSQGVNVSSKHIEIIVNQMTSRVVIKESGDTPFLPGELIRLSLMMQIYESLKQTNMEYNYKIPKYEPLLTSATNSSLSKDGFLSAAGFQETKKVLTRAAIEGSTDWLRGLKECIIIGRLIPAGSSFLNYKNYLDTVYAFKN